eukprot:986473_1
MQTIWFCIIAIPLLIQGQDGTRIVSIWEDDFVLSDGQWYSINSNLNTVTSVITKETYHGPIKFGEYQMTRQFFCAKASTISTSWTFAHCPVNAARTVQVFLDTNVKNDYTMEETADTLNDLGENGTFITTMDSCTRGDEWSYETVTTSFGEQNDREAEKSFNIDFKAETTGAYGLFFDITVECIAIPTKDPTVDPTIDPTVDPTIDPTVDPTIDPTLDPTGDPTIDPTRDPTIDPTRDPSTRSPTAMPSSSPTGPSKKPTRDPTIDPTIDPTRDPTRDPTKDPTRDPTRDPTKDPT